jgi:thioredoxin-like negative regulator of GroEL
VGPDVAGAKLDRDDNRELAERSGIQSIPMVVLFQNRAEVRRFVGLVIKADIVATINSL